MPLKPNSLALFPLWYVAFLFSLTCHEAAHALAAKLGGDLTAFRGGQVTLNPIPHMKREPFGTIVFPMITYALSGWMMGWASAPYDPHWQQQHPRRAAWMALAGPAANLAIVVVAAIGIRAGIFAGAFRAPASADFTHVVAAVSGGAAEGLATFLSILFSLNLLLAAFNLLPIPPLDGNTAAGLFLSDEKAVRFSHLSRNPTFVIIGLLIAWKIFDWVFSPLFSLGLNLLYPGAGYR
jgi:Zn-dependent protease